MTLNRSSLRGALTLSLLSLTACASDRPLPESNERVYPAIHNTVTSYYHRYIERSDPQDPGEAAYAIKVGEQWLSVDNLRRAHEFFENARQLLEHEKTSYEWIQRRNPEGYHRGRAEVEAALMVVLSRLSGINPNPLYLGQLEVEESLFHTDRRALEEILEQQMTPAAIPNQ